MTGDHDMILILDFGGQYTQLIARRVREAGVYSEIHPWSMSPEAIGEMTPKGLIFSGGPSSVHGEGAPLPPPALLDLEVPVLGICYGMQLLALWEGAEVVKAREGEYGRATLEVEAAQGVFEPFRPGERLEVWASHGDRIESLPPGYQVLGRTENAPVAAFGNAVRRRYGVQFHPEVAHTPRGREILEAFLFSICGCRPTWSPGSFVEEAVSRIRTMVRDGRALSALSGGVDSSVATTLAHRALGDRLVPIFVDTGLLRKGDGELVERTFRGGLGIDLRTVRAESQFLDALAGVEDPEEKRRIIGRTFIEVFEEAAENLEGTEYLVQGTLYPDVIESVSVKGPSATIKTHHNVGGLPEKMGLKLVEPLRELFKDEVREVGRRLGLPEAVLGRHPFPGPGLAVRHLGPVTPEGLGVLREADAIFLEEIKTAGLYDEIWQAFAVLLPVRSVGVMGDGRTFEQVVALRAVTSRDGMTADWYPFSHEFLGRVANRIINEVPGVNRVVYDVSSKPPSTIEWE